MHRHEHEKQDTVFAYRHEIAAWSRLRTKYPIKAESDEAQRQAVEPNAYLTEHDAITRTMHSYIAAARAGEGELMRPAFHPAATISGYCLGVEYSGSVEHVFRWITQNGPAPSITPRFARIETSSVIHCDRSLEVQRLDWQARSGATARSLRCLHPASATESGRSRTSSSTGTTGDASFFMTCNAAGR